MTDAAGGLRPAGLGRRWAAGLLDALLGLAAVALCAMWLVLGLWALRGLRGDLLEALVLLPAVTALAAALHVAYHAAFVGGCGQTLGMMALGIGVVVRRDGSRMGHGRALLRTLGGLLDAVFLGLPSAVLLLGPERRGLADRLAGTRVVLFPRADPGDGRQGRLQGLEGAQPLVERGVARQ